jgi:hypothetical protein
MKNFKPVNNVRLLQKPFVLGVSVLFALISFWYINLFLSSPSTPPEIPYYSDNVTNPKIIEENGIYFIEHGYLGGEKRVKTHIGLSPIELSPFKDRYDLIIQASYPRHFGQMQQFSRTEQCIANHCKQFFSDDTGSALVVDIVDIRFSEN